MRFFVTLAALGLAASVSAQATPSSSTVQGTPSDIAVPPSCVSTCAKIAETMGPCDYNPTAANPDTKCACTNEAYSAIFDCYTCLSYLTPGSLSYLQSNLDNYLRQCRTAPSNPVNLANMTVTVPATNPVPTTTAAASATIATAIPTTIAAPVVNSPPSVAATPSAANPSPVAAVVGTASPVSASGSAAAEIPNAQASTTAKSGAEKLAAGMMGLMGWAVAGLMLL